jgi:hypothetical protein
MHDCISSIRYEWICDQLVYITALREKKTQLFSIEVPILFSDDYWGLYDRMGIFSEDVHQSVLCDLENFVHNLHTSSWRS